MTFELLERPDRELRSRIARRTDEMLGSGLIEEAERLLALNLDPGIEFAQTHLAELAAGD